MANTPRIDRLERNYLINGAMDHYQRALGTTNLSGSVVYYLDRWLARFYGSFTGTPTIQQEAVAPDNRSRFCTRVDGNAVNSAAGYEFRQRIEADHCLEMTVEGIASFSAWIYSASALSADLRLFTADATNNFSAVTAFPVGTVSRTLTVGQWNLVKWENIAVPAGGIRGIEFRIELNNMSVTGSSTIHRLTQIQAVSGTRAPNFTRFARGLPGELVSCQRYCVFSHAHGGSEAYNAGPAARSVYTSINFPVTMRATPVVTLGATIASANLGSVASNNPSAYGFRFEVNRNADGIYWAVIAFVADAEL